MTDIQQASHDVFKYLMKNGPNMFRGIYDAKNGNKQFMYGVQIVLQSIAFQDSEETFKQFQDMFVHNMIESQSNKEHHEWKQMISD